MIVSSLILASLIVLIIVLTLLLSVLFGLFYRYYSVKKLNRLAKNKLVLTYDDGPSVLGNATIELLRLMKKLKVKGTFYFIGWRALENPLICDQLIKNHHELGCHTTHHFDSWRNIKFWQTFQDIIIGYSELKQWVKKSAPFRPPHGHITFFNWLLLKGYQARIDFWTHDSQDTQSSNSGPNDFLSKVEKSGGGVVLMHCHHRDQQNVRYTFELTNNLVKMARKNGWEIVTMAQLFNKI